MCVVYLLEALNSNKILLKPTYMRLLKTRNKVIHLYFINITDFVIEQSCLGSLMFFFYSSIGNEILNTWFAYSTYFSGSHRKCYDT